MLTAAILAVVTVAVATPPPPVSDAAAVALVRATPQLVIDTSLPPSQGYDAKLHPYVSVAHAPEGTTGGYVTAQYAREGRLSNGTIVLAVPLDSGGSGGVFTQVIFAGKDASHLKYAGYLTSGGHLGVTVTGDAIVARYPNYQPDDPNCCPTKFNVDTYDLAGGKLHPRSSTIVPASPQP